MRAIQTRRTVDVKVRPQSCPGPEIKTLLPWLGLLKISVGAVELLNSDTDTVSENLQTLKKSIYVWRISVNLVFKPAVSIIGFSDKVTFYEEKAMIAAFSEYFK